MGGSDTIFRLYLLVILKNLTAAPSVENELHM